MMDSYGKVHCAKRGGGVIRDQYGNVLCGVGYCAADDTGRLLCSTIPGGNVTQGLVRQGHMRGGVPGCTSQLCEDLR